MSALGPFGEQKTRSFSTKVVAVTIVSMILAYGSVAPGPLYLGALTFASLAAASAYRPIDNNVVARLYAATTVLLAALLAYTLLQTTPIADGWINNLWKPVDNLIGPARNSISSAPGMTLDALPKLALPFLVFLTALSLFQGDADAFMLWSALAYFGAAYAIFAIFQDLFFPEQLFLAQKRYYVGFLTGTFVNRNTTGTFFGIAFMLNSGLVFHSLRKIRANNFVRQIVSLDLHWRDKNVRLLFHALLCLAVAVALFLTQSRGAVGASFVAIVLGTVVMAMRPLTNDPPVERASKFRTFARIVGVLLVVLGLFALFAGQSIHRMEEQGSEDARWCAFASTIAAIKDHPIFGAGLSTFQDVFPSYRSVECAGIGGIWDHAHDLFLEGYLGMGIGFAIATVFTYALLVGACIQGLRSRHRYRFVPAMGLATLVLVSLHSIVDFSLQIPGVAVYSAAVLASTVTISLGRR